MAWGLVKGRPLPQRKPQNSSPHSAVLLHSSFWSLPGGGRGCETSSGGICMVSRLIAGPLSGSPPCLGLAHQARVTQYRQDSLCIAGTGPPCVFCHGQLLSVFVGPCVRVCVVNKRLQAPMVRYLISSWGSLSDCSPSLSRANVIYAPVEVSVINIPIICI